MILVNIGDSYEIKYPPPPQHFQGEDSGYKLMVGVLCHHHFNPTV